MDKQDIITTLSELIDVISVVNIHEIQIQNRERSLVYNAIKNLTSVVPMLFRGIRDGHIGTEAFETEKSTIIANIVIILQVLKDTPERANQFQILTAIKERFE